MAGNKPKYMELVEWVREQIAEGVFKPGQKILSEHELSTQFHISRQTVRRAITVLEEEGIVESRRGSGTYIRNFFEFSEANSTMNVAVLTTYVEEYIFPSIIQEIERTVSDAGYTIQMAFTHNSFMKERTVLKNILDKQQVDGIIVEPIKSGLPNVNKDLYDEIIKRKIPTLFINTYYPDINLPHVSLDDVEAGRIVTQHLVDQGHRKIAAICKSDDGQGHRRYQGYLETLMKNNITIHDERVVWIDTEDLKDLKVDAKKILKRLRGCTACVCYNDVVATQLLGICKKNEIKVPEELSIIGIDNSELSRMAEVPLSTANNPLRDLGRVTGEKLLKMMKQEEVKITIELKPELVIRNSVRLMID